MKSTTATFTLPATLLSGLLVLSACGNDAMDDMDMEPAATADSAQSGEHNDADIDFASGMIPHHQQAVEMSEMALDQASSPDVVSLAEEIRAAQEPEIQTMTAWLEEWGAEVPSAGEMGGMDMDDMEGMMSAEDMESLEGAQGTSFDTMWLEMMIEHHNGAVRMAQTEVEEGADPDAVALAETIIETQQAEITEMEALLESTSP